jgi:rhamnosyltransferase
VNARHETVAETDLVGFRRMNADTNPAAPRVGAVVVLYEPEADVLENIRALAAQVEALVIVDNGSSEAFRASLEPMMNGVEFRLANRVEPRLANRVEPRLANRVELIRHPENLGIATGFNTGVRRLIDLGCEFVLTFDQDSHVPHGFVNGMVVSMLEAERRYGRVGVLLPTWTDAGVRPRPDSRFAIRPELDPPALLEVAWGISSGSLYRAGVFAVVGFFADEYFIDGIDVEFCLRCRRDGYRIVKDSSRVFAHRLGRLIEVTSFGVSYPITMHGVFRKYYMSRNRVLNYKRYGRLEPRWFRDDLRVAMLELSHVLRFEDAKTDRLWNIAVGIWDGLWDRTDRAAPRC